MDQDQGLDRGRGGKGKTKRKRKQKSKYWEKREQGWVKINFDGSVLQDNSACTGFIIRDHNGDIIGIGTNRTRSSSVLQTEARALREGIVAAKQRGFKKILIYHKLDPKDSQVL